MDATKERSVKNRDTVLQIFWPEGTDEKMLEGPYHRRCEDCGTDIKTRELHIHLKKTGHRGYKARPLCPSCAPKRGNLKKMELKQGTTPNDVQRQQPRIIQPRSHLDPEAARILSSPAFQTRAGAIAMKAIEEIRQAMKKGKP